MIEHNEQMNAKAGPAFEAWADAMRKKLDALSPPAPPPSKLVD